MSRVSHSEILRAINERNRKREVDRRQRAKHLSQLFAKQADKSKQAFVCDGCGAIYWEKVTQCDCDGPHTWSEVRVTPHDSNR